MTAECCVMQQLSDTRAPAEEAESGQLMTVLGTGESTIVFFSIVNHRTETCLWFHQQSLHHKNMHQYNSKGHIIVP